MTTKSGKELFKVGIGTYGIGGRGHRNMDLTEKENDQLYLDAIAYTIQKGFNFTEVSLGYGHGEAMRLLGIALGQDVSMREDLFITHSLYLNDLPDFQTIERDTESFYKILHTAYADSTLVTQSILQTFGETNIYKFLHGLLESGRTRFVSLSNASPAWIKKFKAEFGDAFFAHEGHLSFEIRALQDKGVFAVCDELGVKNIIWRPLGRNATLTRDWELLTRLEEKYKKTRSQIILNWMTHSGYMPMVFSTNTIHIDENYESDSFTMTSSEYDELTAFRPPNYKEPDVDWEGLKGGNDIVSLISNFDQNQQN